MMKVKHMQKVSNFGVKTYEQNVAGTAWKKVALDILLLKEAGYTNIMLKINEKHAARKELLEAVKLVQEYHPELNIKTAITLT